MVDISDDLLRSLPLPQPGEGGDKEERGRVLIVAGSPGMPGAAILAGLAALRAGAGKVQIAVGESIAPLVASGVLEGRVFSLPETGGGGLAMGASETILEQAGRADAVLIGPGLIDEPSIAKLLRRLLPELREKPLLLDAGALQALKGNGRNPEALGEKVILTPHAGEMAVLLGCEEGEVVEDPESAAANAVERFGANVVLKGEQTYIALPDGAMYRNRAGSIGLATGGSGDVLAGLMCGLLARGAAPGVASIWAVYVHALAGERLAGRIGPLGFLARELVPEFPALLHELGGR